ncbi:YlaH-like family protein [uncultured Brevibacillus sp.]|uniref:YlaH-like family protein n=1 Tax=uncultured Brevibacillus sp. TaxID=169970 RepID=UPI002594483B|nr:YlaH-like family protein [uncultured Brevibacillus sp.]
MDWVQLASTYVPANPDQLSAFDSFRLWADYNRAWILFVQLILVYYLGFATRIRMPILKTILLYVLLFAGALIFAILDVQLPVKSAMLVAIAILVIVKLRIKPEQTQRK